MGIKEAETKVKTLETKKGELKSQLESAMATDRETGRSIGEAVASGKSTTKLRATRAETRETIEDLVNALPVVEAQIAEAKESLRREQVKAAQAEVRKVEAKAEAWGEALRKLLTPVVTRMAEVPAMQAEFDKTRGQVFRLVGNDSGGRYNERVTAHSGFSEGFLRDLRSLCDRLEA